MDNNFVSVCQKEEKKRRENSIIYHFLTLGFGIPLNLYPIILFCLGGGGLFMLSRGSGTACIG